MRTISDGKSAPHLPPQNFVYLASPGALTAEIQFAAQQHLFPETFLDLSVTFDLSRANPSVSVDPRLSGDLANFKFYPFQEGVFIDADWDWDSACTQMR